MNEKLLPCPFCGGTDLSVQTHTVQPDNYHGGYVTCIDCDAQGADAITLNGWLGSPEEASNAAITAWNTRAAMQADAAPVATYRHKKRGTLYTVLGEGTLQCSANELLDNQPIVVYRGEDGKLWARGVAEFHDGRFEAVGDRVSTPKPVDDRGSGNTSGKLRDAVEVCQSCGGDGWDGTAYVGQFKCGQCNGTGVVKQSLTTEPLSNSKELRPAIYVFFDAADAGSFGVEPCDAPACTDCAKAAAVIEADRAALVAEIVAWLRDKAIIHRSKWGMSVDPRTEELADMIEAKWGGK